MKDKEKYDQCPRCDELFNLSNYKEIDEDLCSVCKNQVYGSKVFEYYKKIEPFFIKRGICPENISGIRELSVIKGKEYLLAYTKDDKYAGVVFKHDELGQLVHNMAEVRFSDSLLSSYGRWHRIKPDGINLPYDELVNLLKTNPVYSYTAKLNSKYIIL